MSIKNKKQDGFSLIELMVVVSIMAILAVIGLGGFANAQRKARDSRRKADVKTIQNAMVSSTDIGGNLNACAAKNELGGTFPVDPRVDSTTRDNDQYFLFSHAYDDSLTHDCLDSSDSIAGIMFFKSDLDDNVGVVCSTLEAPGTGNTAYLPTGGPADPDVAAGLMVNIVSPTDRFGVSFAPFGIEQANNGSLVINNCNDEGNCNLFCATF